MICALVDRLRGAGFTCFGLAKLDPASEKKFGAQVNEEIDFSLFFRQGVGSRVLEEIFRKVLRYRHLIILGADVMDGYYSELSSSRRLLLADWASKAGLQVTLAGFSFNDSPVPSVVDDFKRIPRSVRICVRDPVSAERLEEATNKRPIPVADLAFMLSARAPKDVELIDWISRAGAEDSMLIGLNAISTSVFFSEKSTQAQDEYVRFHVHLVEAICERFPGTKILFIPHDYRPKGLGEGPILEQIRLALPGKFRQRTLLLTHEYSASEIKWLCGQLDFVVSSRMHLAIASLGQCTPVFCFGYQGKFEGLFRLVEEPELIAPFENAINNSQGMLNQILSFIDSRADIKSRLRSRMPTIIEMAERNIDFKNLA